MAHIYPRNKTWWIAWYQDGRLFRRSLRVKDKKLALHLKRKKEVELEEGRAFIIKDMTWTAFYDEYAGHYKSTRAPKTYEQMYYLTKSFTAWAQPKKLVHITLPLLRRYIDHLIEAKMSPATVNHFIKIMKTMLTYAVDQRYLHENPARKLQKMKLTVNPPRFLTKDEAQKLLKVSKGRPVYAMIATAIYTGVRPAELINLEWQDFDLRKGTLTVRNKEGFKTKSRKFRVIPLPKQLIMILKPYRRAGGLCFGEYKIAPRIALGTVLKKAELQNVTWHDMRHTYASHLAMSGVDIPTISQLLGHADIKTTMIYAHLTESHKRDAVGKLRF